APRETDRQDVGTFRIEQSRDVAQLRRAGSLADALALQPILDAGQHARLDLLRGGPVSVVGNPLQGMPELRVTQALAPVRTQLAIEKVHPAQVQEGRYVNAVGDEANWILLGPDLRPL